MHIRNITSGTLAQVADDKAPALIASGVWEPFEPQKPKRSTAARKTSRKTAHRRKET